MRVHHLTGICKELPRHCNSLQDQSQVPCFYQAFSYVIFIPETAVHEKPAHKQTGEPSVPPSCKGLLHSLYRMAVFIVPAFIKQHLISYDLEAGTLPGLIGRVLCG